MKRELSALRCILINLLVALCLTITIGIGQEKVPGKFFDKRPNAQLYLDREQKASASVKQLLESYRREIEAKQYSFTVGYTSCVGERPDLTAGTIRPRNLDSLARAQNARARRLLELDRHAMRRAYMKDPEIIGSLRRKVLPCSGNNPLYNTAFDWYGEGAVGPARDQGSCGSCWVFGTVGAFESNYAITHSFLRIARPANSEEITLGHIYEEGGGTVAPVVSYPLIDVAEQDILNCVGNKMSCRWGGYPRCAADFLVAEGAAKETDLPYQGRRLDCDPSVNRPYTALTWGFVDSIGGIPSVEKMKEALCTYGPLAVGVVTTPLWSAYTGGVFNERSTGLVCHEVTLVGWNDYLGAWLIKNSRGQDWGIEGFMWIDYGSNKIGDMAMWVQATNGWDDTQAIISARQELQSICPHEQ